MSKRGVTDRGGGRPAAPALLWYVVGLAVVGTTVLAGVLGVVIDGLLRAKGVSAVTQASAKAEVLIGAMTGSLTIAIASGTIWYAHLTNKMLVRSEEELALGRAELEQSAAALDATREGVRSAVRPWLVDVPSPRTAAERHPLRIDLPGYGSIFTLGDESEISVPPGSARRAYLVVPLRNVGSGLAVIVRTELRWGDIAHVGSASQTAVPVGELVRLAFTMDGSAHGLQALTEAVKAREDMECVVRYTNAVGDEVLSSTVQMTKEQGSDRTMKVAATVDLRVEPGDCCTNR